MILLIVLYMLFASTFTLGKASLDYTTPILFIGMRMLFAGGILLWYVYRYHRSDLSYDKKDIGLLAQVSFFQYYAAFILEFLSLQWIASSKACLLFNFSPFITAIISYFVLHECLSKKKLLGLVIGFLGLLPILMASAPEEELAGSLFWFSLPEFLLLAGVTCAAYGWIVVQKAQDRGYSTLFINGISMFGAGVAAFVTSLLVEGVPQVIPPASCFGKSIPWLCQLFGSYGAGIAMFIFYALLLTFISNIVCFNLYGYLLTKFSATFVSFAGFITPLFAALFGWLFLGEHIGWPFIISLVIVFWGLMLFFYEELKMEVI